MGKQAESDPDDWPVWKENQDNLGRFLGAEMDHKAGRAPQWYRDLRLGDDAQESFSLSTPGSSTSRLTSMQAFERGYQGGWK
jgi:hypothetical protein